MLPNLCGLSLRCPPCTHRPAESIDGTLEDAMRGNECGLCFEPLNADSSSYPWTGTEYWLRRACASDPAHFFHAGCLKRHVTLNRYAVCPLCREPLLPSVENLADVPPQPPRRVSQRTGGLDSNDDDAPPSNNDDGTWVEQWRPIYGEEDASVLLFGVNIENMTTALYSATWYWEDEYPNVGTQLRETLYNLVGRMVAVANGLQVAAPLPLVATWARVGSPEHRAWQDLVIEYYAQFAQLDALLSTIVAPPRDLAEDEFDDFDRDALGNPTHPYWVIEQVKEAFERDRSVLLQVPLDYAQLAFVTYGDRTEIRRLPAPPADTDMGSDDDTNDDTPVSSLPVDPTARFMALVATLSANYLRAQAEAVALFNWDSLRGEHTGELPWEILERTKRYILNRYAAGALDTMDFEYAWRRVPPLPAAGGLNNIAYNVHRRELYELLFYLKQAVFPNSSYDLQDMYLDGYEHLEDTSPGTTSPLPPQNAVWL